MSFRKNTIEVMGKVYTFPREKYETDESFFMRKRFFMKNQPDTEKAYLKVLTMSFVFRNVNLLGVSYDSNVMSSLEKYTTA